MRLDLAAQSLVTLGSGMIDPFFGLPMKDVCWTGGRQLCPPLARVDFECGQLRSQTSMGLPSMTT